MVAATGLGAAAGAVGAALGAGGATSYRYRLYWRIRLMSCVP
jgi:hypothetical protein